MTGYVMHYPRAFDLGLDTIRPPHEIRSSFHLHLLQYYPTE
jgi:hypothetical protein